MCEHRRDPCALGCWYSCVTAVHALSCLLLVCRVWAVARRVRSALGEALLAHTVAIRYIDGCFRKGLHIKYYMDFCAWSWTWRQFGLFEVVHLERRSRRMVASMGVGTRHGPDQSMRPYFILRDPRSGLSASSNFYLYFRLLGSLREYMAHLRYRPAQKDRTDPSVGRSRVRECGTSGHAAAH